jgi:hypothetical protein
MVTRSHVATRRMRREKRKRKKKRKKGKSREGLVLGLAWRDPC